MCLGKLQDLLAALYVSSTERKAWYCHSEAVEHQYGLDESMRTALRGLERTALEFYATQLQEKRFAEITKLIPVTSSRHRSPLWRTFSGYAEKHVPMGPKKHIADAIAFGQFLHSIGDALPAEALNILRFELVPWELNFQLQQEPLTLKASGVTLCLIRAHRAVGLKYLTRRFNGYLPSIIGRLQKVHVGKALEGQVKIDSVGIFLKLPLVSWHLEWYVPTVRHQQDRTASDLSLGAQ